MDHGAAESGCAVNNAKPKPAYSAPTAAGPHWSQTYPICIADNTAAPRYTEGEIVHAHPTMPVQAGNWVVIVERAKEGAVSPVSIIGRLVAILVDGDKRTIILHRPAFGDCEIDAQNVLTMHRIVGSSEADT